MRHVEGAPFGTRGGTAVVHHFPADGNYTFQSELYFYYLGELIGGNLPESLQGQELEISIDGERVAAFTIDPLLRGQHRSAGHAADCREGRPAPRRRRVRGQGRRPGRRLGAPGRADDSRRQRRPASRHDDAAPSADAHDRRPDAGRRRVRHAEPPPHPHLHADQTRREETACATRSSPRWPGARSAARRPTDDVDDADADVRASAARTAIFEAGIRTAVQARSRDPEFIFRFERVPEGVDRRPELPHPRPGTGVAALVFPVGRRPRRRAHRRRRPGRAARRRRCSNGRSSACWPTGAPRASPRTSRRSGCGSPAWPRCIRSRRSSPTSPATWRSRCGAKWSCCSTASCARTAASLDLLTADYTYVERDAGASTTASRTSPGPQFRTRAR